MDVLIFFVLAIIVLSNGQSNGSSIINSSMSQQWQSFKLKYRKSYSNRFHENVRFKIFLENVHDILEHNKLFEIGSVPYSKSLNRFADLLPHEYQSVRTKSLRTSKKLTGFSLSSDEEDFVTFMPDEHIQLPDFIDWRELGAVSPVKDQGESCGSCWAISAVSAVESHWFKKTKQMIPLSEQNLLDCLGNHKESRVNSRGCEGGYIEDAFSFIQSNGGISTLESYAYEQKENSCKNETLSGVKVKGFSKIPSEDENALKHAIATVGPVTAYIDASGGFSQYAGGIYFNLDCRKCNADHSVLIVGYGTDAETKQDYWLVKNSYGEEFGENGYVRMARNLDNHCGIATNAIYPLV